MTWIPTLPFPLQPLTKRTLTTLRIYSIIQVINEPTHKYGHIIDWVVVRPDEDIHTKSAVADSQESDHYFIKSYFNVSVSKPYARQLGTWLTLTSIIYGWTFQCISFHLLKRRTSIVNFLRTVLVMHALPSLPKVMNNNSSTWSESIRDELFIAKRERRQAERKWWSQSYIFSRICTDRQCTRLNILCTQLSVNITLKE